MSDQPTFWSLVVTPEKEAQLDVPEDRYINITNACITDEKDDKPVRLIVDVETIPLTFESLEHVKTVQSQTEIAFFVPGKKVHQNLDILFSPANVKVVFKVVGNAHVHLSGISKLIEGLDLSNEQEEEEEEEEKESEGLKTN